MTRIVSDEDLVDAIYLGMASPDLLEHALAAAIDRTGADGGNFHVVCKHDGASALFLGHGPNYSKRNIANYLGHWRHVNVHRETMRATTRQTSSAVFLCHEHLNDDVVSRSPYLNDFYFAIGERWLAGAVAYDDPDYEVSLAFNRGADQERFGEPERRLIGGLLPHVRRAASMAASLTQQATRSLTESLDYSRRAAFLIDGDHRVLWRNAAAERLLETTRLVVVQHGKLAPSQYAELFASRVREAVRRDLAASMGEVMRLGDGAQSLGLEVLPASISTGGVFGVTSAALVMTRGAHSDQAVSEILQQHFGLTSLEARLALDLASGRSVDDVVTERKTRRTNMRDQMRGVFEKLGVRRPAALAALVWRLKSDL